MHASLRIHEHEDWVRLASRFDCGDWVFALWVQIKLSKERDSLAQTSKKLARDLQKVPSFDLSSFYIHICRCNALGLETPLLGSLLSREIIAVR